MVITLSPFASQLIILLIFGIPFLGIGLYILIKSRITDKEFKEHGIPVTAVITDVRISYQGWGWGKSRNRIRVEADVVFNTKNNEEIKTKLDFASTNMKTGQEIPIKYHKVDPKKVTVNTKGNYIFNYIFSAGFIAIGLAITIVILIGMLGGN